MFEFKFKINDMVWHKTDYSVAMMVIDRRFVENEGGVFREYRLRHMERRGENAGCLITHHALESELEAMTSTDVDEAMKDLAVATVRLHKAGEIELAAAINKLVDELILSQT